MLRVVSLVVKLFVVVAAAVVFLSLLVAMLLLAAHWGLRVLWARITGKPAAPWVMGVDPRSAWRATARREAARPPDKPPPEQEPPAPPQAGAAGPLMRPLPGTEEVTDVQARDVRDPRTSVR